MQVLRVRFGLAGRGERSPRVLMWRVAGWPIAWGSRERSGAARAGVNVVRRGSACANIVRVGLARVERWSEAVRTGSGYAWAHRAWLRDERRDLLLYITAHNRRAHCSTRHGN